MFRLVGSSKSPSDDQEFKQALADNENFATDFIGASEQECRQWALENQFQSNQIDRDFFAIADKQSTSDDTLSLQYYNRGSGFEFGRFGILPQKQNEWYNFRVTYSGALEVYNALLFTEPDVSYPSYFGRKEELTDENGIFNVAKAKELSLKGCD